MAHISISPAKDAVTFNPLSKFYDRTSSEGSIPQILFLLGSQYNISVSGETSTTSTGNIINDSVTASSGKLNIAAESSDGTEVEKIMSFVPFMYFYPGIRIVGDSEVQDADVGSGPVPVQRIRYEFENLSTTDKIRVDLQGGDGAATFIVRKVISGSESTVASVVLPTGVVNVKWEVSYLEDGITKIYYKIPSGNRTLLFSGDLGLNIGEAKASCRIILDQQATKTVKSDFIWIYYPNIFVGFDTSLSSRLKGRVRMFDTMNDPDENNWVEVFASDHPFVGERVAQNGILRLWFKTTPSMEFYGWSTDSNTWEYAGKIIPKSTQDELATTLQDIIIEKFNNVHLKLNVKYGIVDHVVNLRRGQPTSRIFTTSKELRIDTTHRRFALSVNDPDTEILDFNQKTTDDANRGNPLNLSPTNNPFTFTDDSNTTTGLDLVDDNWFAWYNENDSADMIGFLGIIKSPTGLKITATTSTQLEKMEWSFDVDAIFCIGVLQGDPTSTVNGIPTPFNVGSIDEYVKWRANEGIYGFNQRSFIRRKR